MRVVFFEDQHASNFAPVALVRPVFELVCGCLSTRERLLANLKPAQWGCLVREELTAVYREEQPDAVVNDTVALQSGSTLLINGRWVFNTTTIDATPDNYGIQNGQVAWISIDADEAALLDGSNWSDIIPQIARSRTAVPAEGIMLEYPWDTVSNNATQLAVDLEAGSWDRVDVPKSVSVLGSPDDIYIDPTAEIDPQIVLDARAGAIRIEANTKITAFTRIAGPCFIGHDTQVSRGLISAGTTIGPVCRIGGEVTESIIHGYVNKSHDGFLGNSYVCPWVNLGAMTTTSNLKNDYSTVRVPLDGDPVETGLMKVGTFFGDHTKAAIDSMFNTGSSIGVMSMILPGGSLLPTFLPSFACIWFGELKESWELDRSLTTARAAMARRGKELSDAQIKLLQHLYQRTANTRAATARRAAEKTAKRLANK